MFSSPLLYFRANIYYNINEMIFIIYSKYPKTKEEISMPELNALRYLIEVSKTNSINKAANNLFISKSAISSSLKRLEDECQTTLFNRSHRGITLTEKGLEVLDLANEVFALLQKITACAQSQHHLSHKISFFVDDKSSFSYVPNLLQHLQSTIGISNFEINIVHHESEVYPLVAQDPYNVGLSICFDFDESTLPYSENVSYEKLYETYIRLLAAQNSKYVTKKQTHTIREILQMPIIISKDSNILENPIFKSDQEANIAFVAPNISTYIQAIADDIGVGFHIKGDGMYTFIEKEGLCSYAIAEKMPVTILFSYNRKLPAADATYLISILKQNLP